MSPENASASAIVIASGRPIASAAPKSDDVMTPAFSATCVSTPAPSRCARNASPSPTDRQRLRGRRREAQPDERAVAVGRDAHAPGRASAGRARARTGRCARASATRDRRCRRARAARRSCRRDARAPRASTALSRDSAGAAAIAGVASARTVSVVSIGSTMVSGARPKAATPNRARTASAKPLPR